MKDIITKIYEANESKDKVFRQLKKGDTIYYLDAFNTNKSHKIEVATVTANTYHEYDFGPVIIPAHYELRYTRKTNGKTGTEVIYERDYDKKLHADTSLYGDYTYHYIATDRELLNEAQEVVVDKDIKVIQQQIEELTAKFTENKKKLTDKYNDLLDKKINKYED